MFSFSFGSPSLTIFGLEIHAHFGARQKQILPSDSAVARQTPTLPNLNSLQEFPRVRVLVKERPGQRSRSSDLTNDIDRISRAIFNDYVITTSRLPPDDFVDAYTRFLAKDNPRKSQEWRNSLAVRIAREKGVTIAEFPELIAAADSFYFKFHIIEVELRKMGWDATIPLPGSG
jgi:hypothetical protein